MNIDKIKKSFLKIKKDFRKYHLIDLFGIGVFFMILFSTALFFLRKSQYVEITLRVSEQEQLKPMWSNNSPEWYISYLKEGLETKDLLGKVNARVENVYYYPTFGLDHTVYIKLKLRSTYNKTNDQYSYNGLPLLIGSYHELKVGNVSIAGIIHSIGDSQSEKYKKYLVRGILETKYNGGNLFEAETSFEGIKNFLALKIEEGLVVVDSKENEIAKITKVKKSLARRQFISGSRLISVIDPERKKIELEVELTTKKVNNRYLYRERSSIFVNALIDLNFEDFVVTMTVVDFEELN